MNETQCAVFQGIVYYYHEDRVICRYQIALHDPVEPALLQTALDSVRPLAEDPPFDPERLLEEFPESQARGGDGTATPVEIFKGEPERIRLRLDRNSMVNAAVREGVKPFSALMGIVCQASGAYLDKEELVYSFPADLRGILGLPNARYNCIATYQLPLKRTAGARLSSFVRAVDAAIREVLQPERLRYRMAEQMGFVCRVFQQKAPLRIQKRVFQMGEYLSGSPADFWVSYLGDPFAPRSPELKRYIRDFQTWVLPEGASLAMEVTSLHDVWTLCIENKVHRPGYMQLLRDAFAAEGVTVLEAVEL